LKKVLLIKKGFVKSSVILGVLMLRIKSEITLLLSSGDMVAKGKPWGKKKIRTVLISILSDNYCFGCVSFCRSVLAA